MSPEKSVRKDVECLLQEVEETSSVPQRNRELQKHPHQVSQGERCILAEVLKQPCRFQKKWVRRKKCRLMGLSVVCYKRIAQTGWLINNRYSWVFLTVLQAGKSKIKVLADSLSSEDLIPDSKTAVFSLCPHMVEGARQLSRVSNKGINCLHPQHLITSQKPYFLIHSGLES